ncbi:MAG: SDR family NAD(P)-dependent oxidoreductase [Myxococcales bacterium]|nr:SDR family NAD(P)-dependent oxidoreductase [Myxococcales bacterium]
MPFASLGHMDISGRVALVTGAARGIGRATALALATAGAQLIISDVNEAGLSELADLLKQRGRLLLSRCVDVSDRAQMQAFAEAVHALVPAVDILVNNAGVGLAGGIETTSLDDWKWVLGVNLWGVIHGCHFFVPKMIEQAKAHGQGGHVVNVSSAFGYYGGARTIGYCTSKFAVFGLSESLRNELAPLGIGVSVICPGVIDTDIISTTRFAAEPGRDPEKIRARVQKMYRKRNFPPEQVAESIVSAVRCRRSVVPVTAEAWLLWLTSRVSSKLSHRIGNLVNRRVES